MASDIAKAFNGHFTSLASTYLVNVDSPPLSMSEQHNFILKKFVQSKLPPGNTFTIAPIRRMGSKTVANLDEQSHRAGQHISKSTESSRPWKSN